MSALLTELSHLAQTLVPEERARLAEVLLESLHETVAPDVEAAWDQELLARIAAYERGEAELVSAEDVFAQARCLTH